MKHSHSLSIPLLTALLLAPIAAFATDSSQTKWHTPRADYKCLYNIVSLMHCNEVISSAEVSNLDNTKGSVTFFSLELALCR